MKIYLAAAGIELAQAQSYITRLQAAGVELTCDWTKDFAAMSAKCRHCDEVVEKHKHEAVRVGVDVKWRCRTTFGTGSEFSPSTDRDLSEADRLAFAKKYIEQGILPADIVWLLCPKTGGAGCFIELGYALATRELQVEKTHAANGDAIEWRRHPQLVFVSGDLRRSIFTALADEQFEEHEKAFERIVALLKGPQ